MLGTKWQANSVDGEMVSVPDPSVVDCGFAPRSVQTKDYEIVFFFFLLIR